MRSMDFILGVEKHLACTSPDIGQDALQILVPGMSWPPASCSAFINVTGQLGHPDFSLCLLPALAHLAMRPTLPKPPLYRFPGPREILLHVVGLTKPLPLTTGP